MQCYSKIISFLFTARDCIPLSACRPREVIICFQPFDDSKLNKSIPWNHLEFHFSSFLLDQLNSRAILKFFQRFERIISELPISFKVPCALFSSKKKVGFINFQRLSEVKLLDLFILLPLDQKVKKEFNNELIFTKASQIEMKNDLNLLNNLICWIVSKKDSFKLSVTRPWLTYA